VKPPFSGSPLGRSRWVGVLVAFGFACSRVEAPPWWPKGAARPVSGALFCDHFCDQRKPCPRSNSRPRIAREPKLIQSAIRKHYGEFRACYGQGLGRNAKLRGRVYFEFSIDGDGSVEYQCIRDTNFEDQLSAECMLAIFGKISFEPAGQDGHTRVICPIAFEPGVPPK
jgi:hypothetical protein